VEVRPLAGRGQIQKKMRLGRSYRDRGLSTEPIKHRKISKANTEMQITVTTGVLDRPLRALLETREHNE